MRWTQTADRRDELIPLELQWVLLKEERLEMHSTHHNQLKVSSYIYAQKRGGGEGGGAVIILQQWKWKPTSSEDYKKKKKTQSDLVAAPNIQTSWWVTNPTELALVPQTHRFSTGSSFTWLRDLTLIRNPSTRGGSGVWGVGGGGVDLISCLSVQHSHSYILLYNWSLRSTESYHGHVVQHLDFNL